MILAIHFARKYARLLEWVIPYGISQKWSKEYIDVFLKYLSL